MNVYDPISKMPDSLLFGALATHQDKGCDHEDRKKIRSLLKKRGYSDDQIDKNVELNKKRWHLKPYYAVTLLRWLFIVLAIPIFDFNYEHRGLVVEVYFEAIVLALLICIMLYEKGYRGSKESVYQGLPLPMNLAGVCDETDFPFLMILTGPLNILIFANLIVFFYVLVSLA